MGKFGKTIDQLRTMFMLEDKYPLLPLFKKRVIEVAQKELKEAYEENQCDLWFDYVQDGRGEKAHFEFFVHTRENQRKQKEAADEVLKKYRGILTFLRATIKKDPKYIERVSKQLELEIEDHPDLSQTPGASEGFLWCFTCQDGSMDLKDRL